MDEQGFGQVRSDDLDEKRDAGSIRDIAGRRFCWLSGLTKGLRPDDWYGDWWLQVAHLSSGSGAMFRVNDRRAVVLLCPLAHECHVHDSTKILLKRIGRREYPTIDASHLIWIKKVFDPNYYDPEYLERIWTGKPPEPQKPPAFWRNMMFENTGLLM